MDDGGWLLIRLSGTEPLIRVYCETTHPDKVQAILEDGLKIAGLKRSWSTHIATSTGAHSTQIGTR